LALASRPHDVDDAPGALLERAVRVCDAFGSGRAVGPAGELVRSQVIVLVSLQDQVDTFGEEHVHESLTDFATLHAIRDAVLVHAHDDPWDARRAGAIDRPRNEPELVSVGRSLARQDESGESRVIEVVIVSVLAGH